MNFVAVFMSAFSVLGALDRIIGNRFGLGKEFERGFMLLGNMALSMVGMIIISPAIVNVLSPFFEFAEVVLHIEPSIIPSSLFANDMGGAPLSVQTAVNEKLGIYNALVVSSMMGCTISFTIPYALGTVNTEHHKEVLLGFLCGIVTIPVGCFVAGIVSGIPIIDLILNLLPLIIFSILIALGLLFCPTFCVKIFSIFGVAIKVIITVGLVLGVLRFLTGVEIIKGLDTLESGMKVCVNASAVMTGAFPFMYIVSKLLNKPLKSLGKTMNINEVSALGFVSSLATSMTTFGIMNDMDKKGIVLNSAFAVSAAFTFAGHLAFTLAFDSSYIFPVIIGKLVAGFAALFLSVIIYKRNA